jgi:hypothetical protein
MEILLYVVWDQDEQRETEEVRLKVQQLQSFLYNMTVYAPISSDMVECWHGAMQHLLHRGRSVRPLLTTSTEVSILYSVACWFQHVLHRMRAKFFPATAKKITAKTKGRAQSSEPGASEPAKKIRALSGFLSGYSLFKGLRLHSEF